jgi:quercetin dioxygenase-like cupin family protein
MATGAGLNADFSKRVVVDTQAIDWQPSPSATVWRKRLDLAGPKETGRVTSIVRYDPDSEFPQHEHPDGEEIFVLEGVFSDEYGHYPAGTFLLNPQGFSHAPRSRPGCVLFVKLRQYPGPDRRQISHDTRAVRWEHGPAEGIEVQTLYREPGHPEVIRLVRLAAGATWPRVVYPGGAEVYVIEGAVSDGTDALGAGTWLRQPAGAAFPLRSETGALFYLRTGHLAAHAA